MDKSDYQHPTQRDLVAHLMEQTSSLEQTSSSLGIAEPPPLLHIGYVKTGSTWLQRHVTDNAEAGFMEVMDRETLTQTLIKPMALNYDPDVVRSHVSEHLHRCREQALVPVITHERLSGNPISGGYDSTIVADRLAELFPDARVIIVIREQRSHLASIYNEFICGGGACSLPHFLYPPDGAKLPLFDFRFLEFHRLTEYYHKLFGQDNVLVLPFELLIRDNMAFCNRFVEFAGGQPLSSIPTQRERPSRGWSAVGVQRRLNFFFCRDSSNPSAPFKIPRINKFADMASYVTPKALDRLLQRRIKAFIEEHVGDRYRESNRKTSAYVDASLAELGYML